MDKNLPFIWQTSYRTGLVKTTGHDLQAVHEKARQYLLNARSKKPRPRTTGTK